MKGEKGTSRKGSVAEATKTKRTTKSKKSTKTKATHDETDEVTTEQQVVPVDEQQSAVDEEQQHDPDLMTVPQLKNILRSHGLYLKGRKDELVERIKTCIPFPAYEPPTDVSYADDSDCGYGQFKLVRAPSSAATCRRCLALIDQGRTKICFPRTKYLFTGGRILLDESFHIECFAKYPPRGIAHFEGVKLDPTADREHVDSLRKQFERHYHDPVFKDTPRKGGDLQAYRVSLKENGRMINGKEDRNGHLFINDLDYNW